MTDKTKKQALPVWAVILALLALAAMVKTMLVGLEIDEQYALSLSYRLLRGDTLFGTMWEPHQLSALPVALVLALFTGLTGGTTGALLFVRAVSLIAKALLALWLYRAFCAPAGKTGAFLAAVVLFLYTPKWFLSPDYTGQQLLFTVTAFLCFWGYYRPGPRRFTGAWRLVVGCAALCLGFLAYPQSMLDAPFYLAGFWVVGLRGGEPSLGKSKIPRGAALLVAGCAACGTAFLLYVLAGISPATLVDHAKLILNDPQYNFTTAQRLAILGGQAFTVAKMLSKPLAAAVLLTLVLHFTRLKTAVKTSGGDLFFLLWPALTLANDLRLALWDVTPDARAVLFVLTASGLWFFRPGQPANDARTALFWLGYLPGVAAYLFILRSTLIALPTTFMYLFWPALCVLLAVLCGPSRRLGGAVLGGMAVMLMICRFWLVLVVGWRPATVADTELKYIPTGPAAYTWADEIAADRQLALEEALAPYAGQQVLQAIGEVNGLGFLMADGTLTYGQASVISGTDSDPRFVQYYAEYPQKAPDVILYDLDEVRDMEVFHAWLEENYSITERHFITHGTATLEVLTVQK